MFYLENAPSPGGSGMSPILFLVIGLIVGAIIMFIINLIRGASASKKSESIIEKAKKDGEKAKREMILEAKEEIHKLKMDSEKD